MLHQSVGRATQGEASETCIGADGCEGRDYDFIRSGVYCGPDAQQALVRVFEKDPDMILASGLGYVIAAHKVTKSIPSRTAAPAAEAAPQQAPTVGALTKLKPPMSAYSGWRAEASRGTAPPEGQHLLTRARAEGDAVRDGRGLQRPQRARLLTVGVGRDQVGLAHRLDQQAPAREHLHEPGEDRLQQRVNSSSVGRPLRRGLAHIGPAPIHAVQH
jgi:hypothetical protein